DYKVTGVQTCALPISYITKSIDDFNSRTYTPATLPSINIVSGEAKLLGFGRRIIICATDIEGETHTLNLSKVQYLLNCGINIFRSEERRVGKECRCRL